MHNRKVKNIFYTFGVFRYDLLCSYFINCDTPKDAISILPENNRVEWGPGKDLTKAGLEPITHKDAIVEAEEEVLEVIESKL